jgi:hypothetical protein
MNLPSFTICSITRYTGSNRGRILSSTDMNVCNFIHGHHNQRRGVAHYNQWMTQSISSLGVSTNWLVMCGQNGNNIDIPNNIIADGNSDIHNIYYIIFCCRHLLNIL